LPCGGFFFKPYDESTYENGACILYKETFTKQDVADFGGDEDTGAVYYQYSSRSNGCKPDFVPTKVVVNGYCSPGSIGYYNDKGGGHTQAACFKMCEKNEGIQCAAASFSAPEGGRCVLYSKEGCTDLEVPPNLNRVLKLWCGRAQVYEPTGDAAEKKQCAADGSWYSSVDENCKEERVCASDEQLFYGACPWADPTLTKKAEEVPVGHAVPLSDLTTNFGKKKETEDAPSEERYNRISGLTEAKCREKIGTPLGGYEGVKIAYAAFDGTDCHTYGDNFGASGDVHGATILAAWNYETYGGPVRNACQGS